jgi:hypothetical protein
VAEEVAIQLSGFFLSVAQSVTRAVLLSTTKILGWAGLGLMPFEGEYQYQTPGRSLGLSQHDCVLNSGLLYLTRLLMFLGSRPVRATHPLIVRYRIEERLLFALCKIPC